MFKITKHRTPGICCAYRCKNRSSKKDRFCSKHRHRFNKVHNPLRYTFSILRSNANRRGHAFKLTFQGFKKFCQETGYMDCKGKKPGSGSIDRIDVTKGYEYSNLQLLTLSENSVKRNQEYGQEDSPGGLPF